MQVVTKRISELIPASYNPRKDLKPGDKDYEKLKHSISEFGYVEPIIWNERTGVVVGGHQRLKVLKDLGYEEVPCVIVNFDEAKEKALNIALNKLSNHWDKDKLNELLTDLQSTEIDIELTGFDMPEINKMLEDVSLVDDGYFGDAREATYNQYRLNEYDETRTAGYYQIPELKVSHYIPEKLIGFNYVKSLKEYNYGVHFFLDDYQFERIWRQSERNIERLKNFDCVFTPDFSLYLDMPLAMKIWNVYRSRLIGQMMQDAGLEVIPTLQWADEETLKFCFDGLPQNGVYAVSTVGVMQDETARSIWTAGMNAAIEKLQPECILLYGANLKGYDFHGVKIKEYEARVM